MDVGKVPLLAEPESAGVSSTSVVSSEYDSKHVVWADAQKQLQQQRHQQQCTSSSSSVLNKDEENVGVVDVVSDAVSSISDDQKPKKREELDEDETSTPVALFSEPWTKDVRRWCLATLNPNNGGERAKIHIAMLRREFLLAAREKPYFKELSGPLNRPRSRDSRTFLAALLHVVGGHAKQSQCVINGVNQIGIIGYTYKRPTAQDYARATKRDFLSLNDGDYFSNVPDEQPSGSFFQQQPYHAQKRSCYDDAEQPSSSLDPSWRFLQDTAGTPMPAAAGTMPPPPPHPTIRLEPAPPGIKLDGGSFDAKDEFDRQPRPPWSDQQQLLQHPSEESNHTPSLFEEAPPVKLQFAVRMFKYGARHQLAVYRLASLRNSPHACEAVLPQNTHLLDDFRPNDWYSTGFDAVALGLLSLGQAEPPIPYAIRTFSIFDTETVRISNPATDMRLPEYLDFDNILNVFDSQIVHLAHKLMSSTRFLTVETHRGSKNHVSYTERGLPIVDNETGKLRGTLFFKEWLPPLDYAGKFPCSHCAADEDTEVVYLRVELQQLLFAPSSHKTSATPDSISHLAPSPAPSFQQVSPSSPSNSPHRHHQQPQPHVPIADGMQQYQQQHHPQQHSSPPQAYVPAPSGLSQMTMAGRHLDFGGHDGHRSPRPSPSHQPTQEQMMQWPNHVGVNQPNRGMNESAAGPMAVAFPQFPSKHMFQPACLSVPPAPHKNVSSGGMPPQPPQASSAVFDAMNVIAQQHNAQRALYFSHFNNNCNNIGAAQKGVHRVLSPGELAAREYSRQLKQARNQQRGSMSKTREESPPAWVSEVRRWASRVLKEEPEGRIHVSRLRDEFLRSKSEASEQTCEDGCKEGLGSSNVDDLRPLFSLPKSHESRLFTKTILGVVGLASKRQQCVIDGVNQCGIVGWRIEYSSCTEPSSANGSPCPSD